MSDKPRVFVSAVSSEFGQTRQDVAHILMRLGYEPVLQDVFGTEAGDLRQMLREKIDACDGLIQIVGQAYGFEPPAPDEEFGRVSYTQFEYLYARKQGKKTWLMLTPPGFAGESASDRLDVPPQPDHPDPPAYRAERRALQARYRERLQQGSDVWHSASDKTELALNVERLRDDLASLRKAFRSWQRRVTGSLAAAVLLLAVVAGGVSWTIYRLHRDDPVAKALAALNPDLIRTQLEKSIQKSYDRDAAEARKRRDWKERQKALREAVQARDQKLAQLDEFLGSITRTIASGQASPEFLELSRILQAQGVNAALEYLSSQESQLLELANQLAATRQEEVRRTLAPLLKGVRLHVDRGDLAEAERLCDKLMAAEPDWPETRHEHVRIMIARGDRALRYENLAAARQRFESARISAERLVQLEPSNRAWQRDLMGSRNGLGDVSQQAQQAGRLDAARDFYQQGLDIAKKLAAADTADAQAQRDLSISYDRLGDIIQQAGRLDAARDFYQLGFDIRSKLAAADATDAQAQRDLSVSYNKLGDVSRQADRLDAAREFYKQDLAIAKKLATADPANTQAQRDLSISYQRLGDLSRQADRLDAARDFYKQYLDITKKLAAADTANVEAQRDLSISYEKLGNMSQQAGRLDAARDFYQQSLDIRKKLAAADAANARAESDLWYSYCKLGLARRDVEMVARGAAGLRNLAPKTPENLYDAACGYGLCAKLAAGWPGHGAFLPLKGSPASKAPDPKAQDPKSSQEYRHTAIDLLQAAVKAGYKNFSWMQQDPDLAALRELPEFKKLLASAH